MNTLNECTFIKTGNAYFPQYWKNCIDCFKTKDEGACLTCVQTCHQGHTLGPLRYGNFFCDCGANKKCHSRHTSIPPLTTPLTIPPLTTPLTIPCVTPILTPIISSSSSKLQPPVSKPQPKTAFYPRHPFNEPTPIQYKSVTDILKGNRFSSICMNTSKKLSKDLRDVVFSPASISFALSLVNMGASGQTSNEITSFLGDKLTINDIISSYNMLNGNIVKTANLLLLRSNNKIVDKYKSDVSKVALVENFNNPDDLARIANTFVEKNTNGLIKKCINPSSAIGLLEMLIINTIYFKGSWKSKFSKMETRNTQFFNYSKKSESKIDMMHTKDAFKYFEDERKQVIEMNYNNDEFCMGAILPKNEMTQFDMSHLSQMTSESVDVFFPKFTQKIKLELVPVLQKNGVSKLFNSSAELKDMSTSSELYVSSIIHECIMIVDEEGTEAAAATTIVLENQCFMKPKETKIFNANHSFMYYIRHIQSNTILFIGEFNGN